ncbi:MAG: DUF6273 domain-containing protein [Bacteroidales bacterium]|nr:DUF6273 domain-containing protein [Bacteroidales bacterium]
MADVCKIKTDSGTYDVYDERVDELLQNTLTIKAASYIGGTWSVTGGDESYSGTIDADETEVGLKAHETTYTVTVTFEGESLVETVTTGIYYNHYEVDFMMSPSDLKRLPWEQVSEIAQAGEASAYWSVGDTKTVEISGTLNIAGLTGTYYAFILGFNHNASLEGENTIHWQIGKALDGADIAFVDDLYMNYDTTGYTLGFGMNLRANGSGSNDGGWAGCTMRSTCGNLISHLPSDLQSVLREITKYTNNSGNSNASVTAISETTDTIFLLSEFELFGTRVCANLYEQNYQEQYDYYAAGNSRIKYQYTDLSTEAYYWLRSPYYNNSEGFVYEALGNAYGAYAYYSLGFAPCFVV